MSFIFGLILIAIAWFLSTIINILPEFWQLFNLLPWWVITIGLTIAIAGLVSEP